MTIYTTSKFHFPFSAISNFTIKYTDFESSDYIKLFVSLGFVAYCPSSSATKLINVGESKNSLKDLVTYIIVENIFAATEARRFARKVRARKPNAAAPHWFLECRS